MRSDVRIRTLDKVETGLVAAILRLEGIHLRIGVKVHLRSAILSVWAPQTS